MTVVEGGAGHVAGDGVRTSLALPDQSLLAELALAAEAHPVDRRTLGRADQRHPIARHHRRHQTPPALAMVFVPGAPAPEFFPALGIVSGDDVAADAEQLLSSAFTDKRNEGRVALEGLDARGRGAQVLVDGLAVGGVHREEEGLDLLVEFFRLVASVAATPSASAGDGHIALEDWHEELPLPDRGAGGEGPLEREVAVVLLQVATPEFLSSEVEGDEITVAIEEDDALAVADR